MQLDVGNEPTFLLAQVTHLPYIPVYDQYQYKSHKETGITELWIII